MTLKPLATTLALMCATLAGAASAAQPLWQTDAVFRTPESVLPDTQGERLFVSNIDGAPNDKDGNGFISLMGKDGHVQQLEWVTGLNAPKGMALVGRRLFVADVDVLVEIDADSGQIVARHPAQDAVFLNDVAADAQGHVYVTDMLLNRIYRFDGKALSVWLDSAELTNPNGLAVSGDTLYVACWGVMNPADFSTEVPGHVKTVSLTTKTLSDYGSAAPIGNLDGIEMTPGGRLLVTDWMAGGLLSVAPDGAVSKLDALAPGSADLGVSADGKTAYIPMMKDGTVRAFSLDD